MRGIYSIRDLSWCGLFGAAAMLLPVLFHMVKLGSMFMPMYLPLVTLAFLVRPLPAAVTGLLIPLVSAALTGMPPFYPPIAVVMALELAAMAAAVSVTLSIKPNLNTLVVLLPVLALGRSLNFGLVYGISLIMELPPGLLAGLSFFSGWPGLILMTITIPPVVAAARRLRSRQAPGGSR